MNYIEARDLLVLYNKWRRDDHIPNRYDQPNPPQLGLSIEIAIDVLNAAISADEAYNKFLQSKSKD